MELRSHSPIYVCLESLEASRDFLLGYTAVPPSLFETNLDRIQEDWDCYFGWSDANGLHWLFCEAYNDPC
ncbi:hypothetical protein TNCT_376631 [Trichonephila clavata]|uniref:Uncharacterized protein n=1 Tax=Trichonephila clavata TaxID=2740835 RepID=A0A8X6L8T8_TRICU|nr:hypothetical protein TNCT_376631 [Trichonephila clavata]